MTLQDTLIELQALHDHKTFKFNEKHGVEKQFGVKLGDIRKVAKKIKSDHKLAMKLWETENFDARMLAILIIKPKQLTAKELDAMVCSVKNNRVIDWLNAYVVKNHPANEELRVKWMEDENPMAARSGWNMTSIRVVKQADMLDIPALLNRLENEMGNAVPNVQWTMNFTLVEIGINHPQYRERALAIGEKLGIYSDYPTSKGCTSPYAPVWINEMVKRKG